MSKFWDTVKTIGAVAAGSILATSVIQAASRLSSSHAANSFMRNHRQELLDTLTSNTDIYDDIDLDELREEIEEKIEEHEEELREEYEERMNNLKDEIDEALDDLRWRTRRRRRDQSIYY